MSLVPESTVCIVCMKKVFNSEKALQCEHKCERWFHAGCVNVSDAEYRRLSSDNNKQWLCNRFDCVELINNPLNNLIKKFETISSQMATIINKLDVLSSIPNDIASINNQLVQVNEKLSNFEPRIAESEKRINSLEKEVSNLKNSDGSTCSIDLVVEEINDRERRTCNVIVYNVPESTSGTTSVRVDHDHNMISKLTSSFCTVSDDSPFKSHRLGRPARNNCRPLRVTFKKSDLVVDFCKNFDKSRLLGLDPCLKDVAISRDRTPKERKYLADLRVSLNERVENGETDLTIKYVNGIPKIVKKSPKND